MTLEIAGISLFWVVFFSGATYLSAGWLLGRMYYDGKWVTPDAKKAEAHFQRAVDKDVAADYYLGQIYRRGYLGQVYPQKALEHLLKAARNGQNSADFAIAQLFSQGKGTSSDGNARLQGYGVDANGNIVNGVLTDLRIDTSNLAPTNCRVMRISGSQYSKSYYPW